LNSLFFLVIRLLTRQLIKFICFSKVYITSTVTNKKPTALQQAAINLKSKQTEKQKTIAGCNPSLFAVGFLLQRRGGGDRNLTGRANQNAGEVLPHTNRGGETSRGDHVARYMIY
jgi:hypothetical protein